MPSTFTPNKGFEKQATGENAGDWGEFLNDNFISLVDAALGGQTSITLSNANVTLDSTQAINVSLRMNGVLTTNITVTNPNKGFYVCENLTSGNFTVSVTNGVGSPLMIPQTSRAVLFADATNGVRMMGNAGTNVSNQTAFPIGTQMLFAQAAVPSGWTLFSSLNDYAIKVGATGLQTSGAVNFSTVFGLLATGQTTLTLSHMPVHTHTYFTNAGDAVDGGVANPYWAARNGAGENYGDKTSVSSSSGGGGSHAHAIDMRIKAMTTIIGIRAA